MDSQCRIGDSDWEGGTTTDRVLRSRGLHREVRKLELAFHAEAAAERLPRARVAEVLRGLLHDGALASCKTADRRLRDLAVAQLPDLDRRQLVRTLSTRHARNIGVFTCARGRVTLIRAKPRSLGVPGT